MKAQSKAKKRALNGCLCTGVKVGDGATVYGWTDRRAYTVIAVSKSGRTITIQRDSAKLLNGPNSGEPDALHFEGGGFCGHTSGVQRYEIKPDPNGEIRKASLRKDGKWREANSTTRVEVGERFEFYDYNF